MQNMLLAVTIVFEQADFSLADKFGFNLLSKIKTACY